MILSKFAVYKIGLFKWDVSKFVVFKFGLFKICVFPKKDFLNSTFFSKIDVYPKVKDDMSTHVCATTCLLQ